LKWGCWSSRSYNFLMGCRRIGRTSSRSLSHYIAYAFRSQAACFSCYCKFYQNALFLRMSGSHWGATSGKRDGRFRPQPHQSSLYPYRPPSSRLCRLLPCNPLAPEPCGSFIMSSTSTPFPVTTYFLF
jgi:hypothetical protein